MTWGTFASWAGLMVYLDDHSNIVHYKAPLDTAPVLVVVAKRFKNGKLRIKGSGFTFTADSGHLDRFRAKVDDVPPCAASMGCLCAGHARGLPAEAMCDTREQAASLFDRGDRVRWKGKLATVVYRRMAPPTYAEAAAYSLRLDAGGGDTIVAADEVAAVAPAAPPFHVRETRYPELGFAKITPTLWRIVDRDTNAAIGPQYKSRSELLQDLESFAHSFGLPRI